MALVDDFNEEQFRRVLGTRQRSAPGAAPSAATRDALTKLACYHTGAPKGVFRYRSHEEANAHREAWTIARIVARKEP